MSDRVLYYDEIASSLISIVKDVNTVTYEDFLIDMKTFIIDKYNNQNLNEFRGSWKTKFKKIANDLKYIVGKDNNNNIWASIVAEIKEKRTREQHKHRSESSTSSASSNRVLTSAEKALVIEFYNKIEEKDKGTLSTGKKISECMLSLANDSIFEHPVHSYIFDTSDPVWDTCFTKEELKEAKNYNTKLRVDIPEELQAYLSSFENKEFTTASDYYDHALEHKFPLGKYFNERWIQESVVSACELFYYHQNQLNLKEYLEGNMLHEVWEFVYKLFKDREITIKLGEPCSIATSLEKNKKRCLEAITPRERKATGSKIDVIFNADNTELGACEAGKGDVSKIDDKYLNDGFKKLPKTLRDMLISQILVNPGKANSLCTVGYLMMGLHMELLVVDMPFGNLVLRVVRSCRLIYPVKIKNFAVDFIPLLELAYTGKHIMQNNINVLDDRKRKKLIDDDGDSNDDLAGEIPLSLV
ncbi:hypothetical protein BDF21DRAFT_422251 [Thamnidium elegans]|nr:hypothetical protein BDF21DRAFT_422251 [Thamnidium elegans]